MKHRLNLLLENIASVAILADWGLWAPNLVEGRSSLVDLDLGDQ